MKCVTIGKERKEGDRRSIATAQTEGQAALIPLAKVLKHDDSHAVYGAKFMGQCDPNCESQFYL
jgi:hypothetical protein